MPKIDFTQNNFEMKVGNKKVIGLKLGEKTLYNLEMKRQIELGDMLAGKTISIEYPSKPIQITDTSECYYGRVRAASSDSNYRIVEAALYDIQDGTDTYTDWVFTSYLRVFKNNEMVDTLYQCDTKVRITYDSSGNETGKTIQSTTESIKKNSYTFDDDFDWVCHNDLSSKNIYLYTDIFTQTKDYYLESLEYTDDLINNYTLVFNIPKDFEKIAFPQGKPNEEYSNSLFSIEKDTSETFYYTDINLIADYKYDDNGNKTNQQYWGILVTLGVMDNSSYILLKEFEKEGYSQLNNQASIGGWDIPAPLTTLNKKNPIYPYVKKVVWK